LAELAEGEFDEQYEGEEKERSPPGQIPEELGEGDTGRIEPEQYALPKSSAEIGFGCPLIEKPSSEIEETEEYEERDENRKRQEEANLPPNRQRRRIRSKNENAEDAEGREREEARGDHYDREAHAKGTQIEHKTLLLVYGLSSALASIYLPQIKENLPVSWQANQPSFELFPGC